MPHLAPFMWMSAPFMVLVVSYMFILSFSTPVVIYPQPIIKSSMGFNWSW